MKKFLFWIIVLAVIAAFITYKARNVIAKHFLENSTRSLTNLELSIDDVNIDIPEHIVSAARLKIYNPDGFEKAAMFDIPFLGINYDTMAAIQRKVHFHTLKLDINELLIIRNRRGNLNFMSIKGLQRTGVSKRKGPGFKIDKLYLSVGRVVFKDYFKTDLPIIKVYNLNLRDQLFKNVNDPKTLISAVIHKSLIKTDILELLNFNINVLKENIKDVIDKGAAAVREFDAQAEEAAKTAEGTTTGLKETIKNLFRK